MTAFVHISFEHAWSEEQLQSNAREFAVNVKPTVPGLLWKIFTNNSDTNESCGCYLFDTLASAQAYLDGERVAGMRQSPEFKNISARIGTVLDEASALAGAPLPPA